MRLGVLRVQLLHQLDPIRHQYYIWPSRWFTDTWTADVGPHPDRHHLERLGLYQWARPALFDCHMGRCWAPGGIYGRESWHLHCATFVSPGKESVLRHGQSICGHVLKNDWFHYYLPASRPVAFGELTLVGRIPLSMAPASGSAAPAVARVNQSQPTTVTHVASTTEAWATSRSSLERCVHVLTMVHG